MATVDLLLRLGRHGDGFLSWSNALSLAKLAAHPRGIDPGPLEPGVARCLLHGDGRLRLAAAPVLVALAEVRAAKAEPRPRSCSSATARSAPATRGCTACRGSGGAGTAVCSTCTRPTPSAPAARGAYPGVCVNEWIEDVDVAYVVG